MTGMLHKYKKFTLKINMEQKKLRVAIVVQRYGEEVLGGAELHARLLAEHLLDSTMVASVDVLTTCATDFITWANHYPPGVSMLNGVKVHRFEVEHERIISRGPGMKNLNDLLLNHHTPDEQFSWMWRTGPASTGLLAKIERSYDIYDAFVFYTFEYASTFFGLPLVSDKAILVPTAHDQPSLYLSMFRWLFHLPRAIAYNTPAERRLVHDLLHNERVPSIITGIGIDRPEDVSAARFRAKFGIDGKFICFLGRLVAEKGVGELVNYFIHHKDSGRLSLDLVLMGKGPIPIPDRPDIIRTGFISDQDKFDGLLAAEALIVPSRFESLSMIALESWMVHTPVIVSGHCEVLTDQIRYSQGGLFYINQEEFGRVINYLESHPEVVEQMGQNGHDFVRRTYDWGIILEKYEELFRLGLG